MICASTVCPKARHIMAGCWLCRSRCYQRHQLVSTRNADAYIQVHNFWRICLIFVYPLLDLALNDWRHTHVVLLPTQKHTHRAVGIMHLTESNCDISYFTVHTSCQIAADGFHSHTKQQLHQRCANAASWYMIISMSSSWLAFEPCVFHTHLSHYPLQNIHCKIPRIQPSSHSAFCHII